MQIVFYVEFSFNSCATFNLFLLAESPIWPHTQSFNHPPHFKGACDYLAPLTDKNKIHCKVFLLMEGSLHSQIGLKSAFTRKVSSQLQHFWRRILKTQQLKASATNQELSKEEVVLIAQYQMKLTNLLLNNFKPQAIISYLTEI